MEVKRVITVGIALCATLAVLALPASAAVKLPVQTAADKAFVFAKHLCAHDPNCEKYGVTNCRRQSLHVVLCRIFDDRDTEAQGRYTCTRLVRVVLDPATYRIVVTGLSKWSC